KDILGHDDSTDPNAAGYLAQLNAASPANATGVRMQIALKLSTSDENLRRELLNAFEKFVGRTPKDSTDPSQSEYAVLLPILRQTTFPAGGLSPDQQLFNALVLSTEYFQRIGNSNRAWSTSMYTKVMSRPPSVAEVNGVLGGILNLYAPTRQVIALGIATSAEHKARVVGGYYTTFLRRSGSTAEINNWVVAMQQGLSDEAVAAQFLSAPEYFPTSGP